MEPTRCSTRSRGVEVRAQVLQAAVAHDEGDGATGLAAAQEMPGRGEMGARGEAGEDPLLGSEEPSGGDGFGVADPEVIGHERAVEEGQVGPCVPGPLELVARV